MEKRSPASGNRSRTPQTDLRATVLVAVALLSFAFTFSFLEGKKGPEEENVRKAAVASVFYPGDKATLEKYVDTLLAQAQPPKIEGSLRAIMVPHAGYVYSGQVAAYAYKELEGRDIRTVILLGNSHTQGFDGISVYKKGSFETPLGRVKIDEKLAEKIIASDPRIKDRPSAHARDHILEVQLPFLQRVLKDFKIVPIVFGSDDPKLTEILARTLKEHYDDRTLIVASTDMSHYPSYEAATIADEETLRAIGTGHAEALDNTMEQLAAKGMPNTQTFLCGVSGVRTVLLLAQALAPMTPVVLKYANSGDVSDEKSRVVGYGAVAFVSDKKTVPLPPSPVKNDGDILNEAERKELLGIARSTVESYVQNGIIPAFETSAGNIQKPLGAFVTLKENGQLRGCIGRFEASEPLYKIVQQMAVAAATQDTRFNPVSPGELKKLEYEISVLSPLRKILNAEEIALGRHGVSVSKGFHHGVFLPQVATETGWSKEEFLSELCSQKAGLPRNCWQDPKVDLQVFTAEVFSEEKEQH